MDFEGYSLEMHSYYMQMALQQARFAYEQDEVPIGVIIVADHQIIAKAHNSTQLLNDVTAHAEMLAITAASNHLGNKYLYNATLYVTLEPCLMCTGALFWSKIARVVYAASDPNMGACNCKNLHPKTEIVPNILAEESMLLLQDFFQKKRR